MKLPAISRRNRVALLFAGCALGLCWCWFSPPKQPRALGEMTNSLGMKLMLIPAGEFEMGSSQHPYAHFYDWLGWKGPSWLYDRLPQPQLELEIDEDEQPRHRVRITRPFFLGAHEVTIGQYAAFDKESTVAAGLPKNHPAAFVSWDDAAAFCAWLSKKERAVYRLPTEAEWEYACRAGTTTDFSCGDDPKTLKKLAHINHFDYEDPFDIEFSQLLTRPVGSFTRNAFGLFDMHGNAAEWCADLFDGGYYASSPIDDPQGPMAGGRATCRVLRGGSYYDSASECRSANRSADSMNGGWAGFRVVREASPAEIE